MKKLGKIFRSKSKSRESTGSAGSSALDFDELEIKSLPNVHQAIINGDHDKVKKLLKSELEVKDNNMRTPLYIACMCQQWDIVSMLLDAKCKLDEPDKNGITPLMKAIEAKNSKYPLFGIAQANQFVSYGCNILRVNNENRTCFHYLAMSKCSDRSAVFSALLNSRKSKKEHQRLQDLQDKDRLSALHLSVMADNVDVCQALIANGANVDLTDNYGRTPLMLSCSSGNEEICRALLAANANLHLKDSKGRSALTLARESSTQRCVILIEEQLRLNPQTFSSSEQSQSWEDVTAEEESDEAEEVDEDISTESPPPSTKPAAPSSTKPLAPESKSEVVTVTTSKVDADAAKMYSPSPTTSKTSGAEHADEISTSSEEPVFGTVRFKDGESPRPKIPTAQAISASQGQGQAAPVTVVKPVVSVSSPRTSANVSQSSKTANGAVSIPGSLLKTLAKSNDSADDLNELEFNFSGSGEQRSKSGNGNKLVHSFDMTSDVVKTSIDSVTSGMTTEWDSATEPSGAYSVPHKHPDKDVVKTDDDDGDDWSDGPALLPVHTPIMITAIDEAGKGATMAHENKERQKGKAPGDQATNQFTSLVAESVRRVIVGVDDETATKPSHEGDVVKKESVQSGKPGGSTVAVGMYDDSDLSEIALSNTQDNQNSRRPGDSLKQSQTIEEHHATRPSYLPSQTSLSQASSRWDTEDNSMDLGGSGHKISPSRIHPKHNDDDTDISSDEVDDDEHSDVAAEMGKYLEGSLIGEGGNWLGPTKERDRSHLPPMKEVTPPPSKVVAIVTEGEPVSRSRRSSTGSLNQQNPSDWLGIEADVEPKVRKNSPVSVIAVAEVFNGNDRVTVDQIKASVNAPSEAFAGASEISMPASPALSGFGLMSTQVLEGRGMSYSLDSDGSSLNPTDSLKITKSTASPRMHPHHFNESRTLSTLGHDANSTKHGLSSSEFSPRFTTKSDDDDIHDVLSNDGDHDVQPMIDNLFTLSGSITDTFQLTKVQEAIRQLSSRSHADERKIAGLQTENTMLRDDISLLEQKLETVNAAKSLVEKSCAQLELKISALETEQVSDARRNTSATERLRIELQEAEHKLTSLQDESRRLERERNNLEAKLTSLEGLLKQVEAERDFAKQQHTMQAQQLLTVSTSNRDELKSEIARLMEENSKLNTRLDDALRSMKRSESELDGLRNDLMNAKANARIAEQRVEEVKRSNDSHARMISDDASKKDNEIIKLSESHRGLLNQLEVAQAKVVRLESDLSAANRSASERTQQLQAITDEARIAKIEANNERDHVRKLELKNESLEQRILDGERRLNELQRQLDDSNHALTVANRRVSGASEMYASGPSPLDTRSLSLMEMRCHELLEAKGRLTEDLVRMESAKKTAEQEVKHVNSRLVDLEKRATQAEITLEGAQRALEDANRKAERAGDENRRAQAELAERNSEVDRLRRELSAFHEAASDLVGRSTTAATVSELRTRLKVSEDELKAKEAELNELRHKADVRDQLMSAEMAKLKARAEDARQLWEQEVKTKAGVGQLLLEAERRRDAAENDLLVVKNETHRLEDQLRMAERRLEDEHNRVSEADAKVSKIKSKMAELKIKLVGAQGYDDKLADLSRQLDQQRIGYDERITLLKKQLEDARKEVECERCIRDRTEADRRNLELRIARVASLEVQVNELTRQKAIIETDFAQYRDAISRTHVERSVMDFKLQETEAKLRAELDTKVARFHMSLADLDRERDHTDEVRHANEQAKAAIHDFEKQQLLDEVNRVRSAYNSLVTGGGEASGPFDQGQPITSTPLNGAEPPSMLMGSPTQADGNTTAGAAQPVSRRLLFERLQPVLGSEHLSKILNSQLSRQPPAMSTSMISSRIMNSSAGRLPSSLDYSTLPRGSVLSASFHYSVPSTAAYRNRRRDFSIESLRAQLDRAVALGLSGKPFVAPHSMM